MPCVQRNQGHARAAADMSQVAYLISLHDNKSCSLSILLGNLLGFHSLGKLQANRWACMSRITVHQRWACPICVKQSCSQMTLHAILSDTNGSKAWISMHLSLVLRPSLQEKRNIKAILLTNPSLPAVCCLDYICVSSRQDALRLSISIACLT